jgi:hypothetical protein
VVWCGKFLWQHTTSLVLTSWFTAPLMPHIVTLPMLEHSLRSEDEMLGAKGEVGGRYRLQPMVHKRYGNQEWNRHCGQQES